MCLFAKSATAYNPFIYFFMFKGFRQDTVNVFKRYLFVKEKSLHICIISRRFFYNPENEIVNNYSSGHKSELGWPFSRTKMGPYLFSYRFSVGMRAAVGFSSFQKPRANSIGIGPENLRTSNTSNFLYQCYKVCFCKIRSLINIHNNIHSGILCVLKINRKGPHGAGSLKLVLESLLDQPQSL